MLGKNEKDRELELYISIMIFEIGFLAGVLVAYYGLLYCKAHGGTL